MEFKSPAHYAFFLFPGAILFKVKDIGKPLPFGSSFDLSKEIFSYLKDKVWNRANDLPVCVATVALRTPVCASDSLKRNENFRMSVSGCFSSWQFKGVLK